MGAKHNFGYSPDEIKEKINEVTETLSEVGNRWKQARINGEEERIHDELHPEPLPASPEENGEALESAEKSGNYDTEEYKEAAEYAYNRDGDVDTLPSSDNYGFTLANQGVQPTGVTEDGTTYYIENGKTYMGPKVKDLDGIPSNERSNNHGFWLEEQGETPTGIYNGRTYFTRTRSDGTTVDYIGYPINQDKPKTLRDYAIETTMENEGDQYKPYTTLLKNSSSINDKNLANESLSNEYAKNSINIPNYIIPDMNSHEYIDYLRNNFVVPEYFDDNGYAHYLVKAKNGMIVDLKGDYIDTYKSYNDYKNNSVANQEKLDAAIEVLDKTSSVPYIGGVSKVIVQLANGYNGALEVHNAVYQWKVNNKIYNSYNAGQMNKYVLYKGGANAISTFVAGKVGKDKVEQALASIVIGTASDKGGEYLYNKASENTPNKFNKNEKEQYDQVMKNIDDYTEVDK